MIFDYVKDVMVTQAIYDELIVVFEGVNVVPFSHAATFLMIPQKGEREVFLLDCKNDYPLNCRFSKTKRSDLYPVEPEKDLEDDYYHSWRFFSIVKRKVDPNEEMRIEAKIKFILSGEKSTEELRAIASKMGVEKRKANAGDHIQIVTILRNNSRYSCKNPRDRSKYWAE